MYTVKQISEDYNIDLKAAELWVSFYDTDTIGGYNSFEDMALNVLNTIDRLEDAFSYGLIREDFYYEQLYELEHKAENDYWDRMIEENDF